MAKLNGNDLIIAHVAEGTVHPFAASKSCEIETDCEPVEISSPSSGVYRSYVAGRKVWMVRLNYLVDSTGYAVLNTKNVGNTYRLKCYVRNNSVVDKIEGDAILTSCVVSAIRGNLIIGSWTFQGSGDI